MNKYTHACTYAYTYTYMYIFKCELYNNNNNNTNNTIYRQSGCLLENEVMLE